MVCHKCGFEHNSDKECPKCGATVIKVNEEYLKRKKAYEESGKITFAGIDVDTLDKMSNTKVEVNIEEHVEKELSPKEAMAVAYEKMKDKGQSILKNSKKRTNKNDKSSKEKKQKRSVDYSLWIKMAAIAMAVILFITVIVVLVNKVFFKKNAELVWLNEGSLYINSGEEAMFTNVDQIIENDAKDKLIVVADKTYMYAEEKKSTVSEKIIESIYYNDEMSLLLYHVKGEDNIYLKAKGKEEVKLDVALKITDCYVSKNGKFAAFVAYNGAEAKYSLYKVDSVGHVTNLETNESEKDISIVKDDGTIILMDYAYSDINSVVTSKLRIYRANLSGLEVENVTEFIVYENYVIFIDGKSQMHLMDYTISAPYTLVFDHVEEIYTATDNNNSKYTNYGDKICYKGDNDKIIVMSNSRLYLYDLEEQVTTYITDCGITSIEMYYFEDAKYCYYKTAMGINKVELKTAKITFMDTLLPSDKILVVEDKKTIVYRDYYGKLVEVKNGQAIKIDEGVKEGSLKLSQDGLAYSYLKDVTVYAKRVGKGETVALYSGVESISQLTNIVFTNKRYYFRDTNGKLYESGINGKNKKIISDCSQLYIIYKKGI